MIEHHGKHMGESTLVDDDDWRLSGHVDHLMGAKLRWSIYRKPRPAWDHDHCVFCTQKIMEEPHPRAIQAAYVAVATSDWVCPDCFTDFRERFRWEVLP